MPILEAACMLLSQTQSHFDNIVSSKDAKLMYILNVFNKYAPFVVVNLVICRMVIHLKKMKRDTPANELKKLIEQKNIHFSLNNNTQILLVHNSCVLTQE